MTTVADGTERTCNGGKVSVKSSLVLLLTATVMATGCGSEAADTKSAAVPDMVRCLSRAFGVENVSTSKDDLDLIAAAAGVQGINVAFDEGGQNLNVAVERSPEDAKTTLKQYAAFLPDAGPGQAIRIGDAAVVFDKTPTADETTAVQRCVSFGAS